MARSDRAGEEVFGPGWITSEAIGQPEHEVDDRRRAGSNSPAKDRVFGISGNTAAPQ
jgi:hypothetical protein